MSSVARSATWIGIEAVGGALFSSVGLLIIAGLIGPRELGLSAIALGIMQTVNFFPDTLFGDAIIQRQRLSVRHVGSAFWSVVMLSILLGAAVAASAGVIARLYGEPQLAPLLLVLAISCLPTGIASVQCARLRRAMRFRDLAVYAVVSRSLATAAGLMLAIKGYGAWAVVAQNVLVPVFLVVELLLATSWRFVRHCSIPHAREIGVFALTRTATHFLDVSRGRLFFVVLGQYLPLTVLGQVNFAFRLVDSLTTVLATMIGRLYLPMFSRLQGSLSALIRAMVQANLATAVLLLPLYTGMFLLGNDIVRLVGGETWQAMGAMIPWLSVAGMAVIVCGPATAGLLAIGRPFLVSLGTSSTFAAIFVLLLSVAPADGREAVICWALGLCVGVPINFLVASCAMGMRVRVQLGSLAPGVLVSALVAAAVLLAKWLHPEPSYLSMGSAVLSAGCVYLVAIAMLVAVTRRGPRLRALLLWWPDYRTEAR